MAENFFFKLVRPFVADYLAQTSGDIEETIRHSIANHPLPICLVNSEGTLVMTNGKFKTIFPAAKLLKTRITDVIGEDRLQALKEDGKSDVRISAAGCDYNVLADYVSKEKNESAMYFFVDVTELERLRRVNEDEKICYCYLTVDNYEDLLQASPDGLRSMRASAVESLVRQFAADTDGALLRYRDSSWQIVFDRSALKRIKDEKFKILGMARNIENDADFPTSFSLGIGVGEDPTHSEEYAMYALDLARGRGGDQVVIKNAEGVDYFGGSLQVIENRSKGKSRVMSHAIRQLVSESPSVVIMGHKYADIDSFGAAVALAHMITYHGKSVSITMSAYNYSLDEVVRVAKEEKGYRILSGEETEKILTKETLLMVIDTHIPDMVDTPSLLGKTEKMVLIDHHRKRESVIENATLIYMEPNASSTSELVTEILQFDEEIRKIGKFEAEMLLGGIFIDTNSFSVKTGARTFEAAAWLRMNGAETTNVRQFLQNDMDDFKQRASIIFNAEFTQNGIAISRNEGMRDNAPIIIAQAADELLDIKGIRASFVAGQTRDEIVVSARSLGELNVQIIMERFGGGGHMTMAAAQIKDMTIDEVVNQLKEYIREAEGGKT
ncbi:phosphoesterase [Clostridia bacterium]|nr:phosphoesterase [Clostridia bacterium]